MNDSVAVIVPAHDEAERITATLDAIREALPDAHVVVVDDGSDDDTTDRARMAGADEVLTLPRNLGKTAALDEGIRHATRDATYAVLVVLDADLGESARDASILVDAVMRGEADLVIAAFPPPSRPGGFGLVKRLARWGIARFGSGDFSPTAPLSGQRAFSPRVLDTLPPSVGYGFEVAMTVGALRAGLRVTEVVTSMRHRETGRDIAGILHRGRQFKDVALTLVGIALRPTTGHSDASGG